jgi:hypothetical protein
MTGKWVPLFSLPKPIAGFLSEDALLGPMLVIRERDL